MSCMYYDRLVCRPLLCIQLNIRFSADSIPSALTIFSITWLLRLDPHSTDCVLFVCLLDSMAGHLIDVLVRN
jgi:hypothetical protein